MPAYAAQTDLNIDGNRLIELTDNVTAPGVLDTALLARLETEAEAIVNAVVGQYTTVPFTVVPPIVTFITASIWAYRIYRHRPEMPMPPTIEDDYKMAQSFLAQVIDGSLDLIGDTDPVNINPAVESAPARGWTPRDLVT